MRLEDMNQEFPKMPEEMRAMIEKEVEKQMKITDADDSRTNQKSHRCSKKAQWSLGRAAAVALVATMALGTTVFAGVKLYQMQSEKEGNYGLVTKIEQSDTEGTASMQTPAVADIPNVKMETAYLPEGMSAMNEEGIYCYDKTPYEGGFSVFFFRMDQGDDAFELLDKNVISSEEISLNGHQGIYFVKQGLGGATGSQHIYLAYPEVHYVLDLYIGEDVTKEEALKFAEGIRLTPTDDEAEIAKVRVENWSSYVDREKENAKAEAEAGEDGETQEMWRSVSKDEFEKNTHKIGENISLYREWGIGGMPEHDYVVKSLLYPGLDVKVTDVKVTDNLLSVLSADKITDDVKTRIAEDGTILPIDMNYVKYGDGINSIDEIVKTKKVTPKFVYATVEYANHGEETLSDVLVNATLLPLQEKGNNVTFYEGEDEAGRGSEWDICVDPSYYVGGSWTPVFDLAAEKTEKNHILDMKPGETATLHVGFFVTEDELPYLYLNIDPYAVHSEFSDTGLDLGYVDIRQ